MDTLNNLSGKSKEDIFKALSEVTKGMTVDGNNIPFVSKHSAEIEMYYENIFLINMILDGLKMQLGLLGDEGRRHIIDMELNELGDSQFDIDAAEELMSQLNNRIKQGGKDDTLNQIVRMGNSLRFITEQAQKQLKEMKYEVLEKPIKIKLYSGNYIYLMGVYQTLYQTMKVTAQSDENTKKDYTNINGILTGQVDPKNVQFLTPLGAQVAVLAEINQKFLKSAQEKGQVRNIQLDEVLGALKVAFGL